MTLTRVTLTIGPSVGLLLKTAASNQCQNVTPGFLFTSWFLTVSTSLSSCALNTPSGHCLHLSLLISHIMSHYSVYLNYIQNDRALLNRQGTYIVVTRLLLELLDKAQGLEFEQSGAEFKKAVGRIEHWLFLINSHFCCPALAFRKQISGGLLVFLSQHSLCFEYTVLSNQPNLP